MDFTLTDEQRAIQDLAQQIFRDQATAKRVAEIASRLIEDRPKAEG